MLSHYDAVIWETGDDLVTRTAGRGGGNADRLALDEMLEFRSYMNEGGKVLLAGDSAGQQYTHQRRAPALRPQGRDRLQPAPPRAPTRGAAWPCSARSSVATAPTTCCSTTWVATSPCANDGHDETAPRSTRWASTTRSRASRGASTIPIFAGNTNRRSSFIATSGILPPDQFKQFESWASARWDKPGGPFDPHTGTQYVYSQIADVSYKRLTREIAVPPAGGSMTFWTSYDTEPEWDHLFVEARTAGGDDWTTLPDANGNTTHGDRPELRRGLGRRCTRSSRTTRRGTGSTACTATGTTGAWNAASGNSAGWQQWSIDLSAYAGETVEISIAYASDWATQGIGVFVDDITLPDGTSTSFETGLDGWAITGPPEGSAPNVNNFIRTDASGFPVGNAISTPHSLLLGFGLEGVSTAAERNAVMGRALDHLLE